MKNHRSRRFTKTLEHAIEVTMKQKARQFNRIGPKLHECWRHAPELGIWKCENWEERWRLTVITNTGGAVTEITHCVLERETEKYAVCFRERNRERRGGKNERDDDDDELFKFMRIGLKCRCWVDPVLFQGILVYLQTIWSCCLFGISLLTHFGWPTISHFRKCLIWFVCLGWKR